MKRTSNMRWAKFAAGAAVGLGMLAGAASPALATEILALTINPTGKILPGRTAVTITGNVMCDVPGSGIAIIFLTVNQTGRNTQFINAVFAPPAFSIPLLHRRPPNLVVYGPGSFSYLWPVAQRKSGRAGPLDDFPDTPHDAFATVFIQ